MVETASPIMDGTEIEVYVFVSGNYYIKIKIQLNVLVRLILYRGANIDIKSNNNKVICIELNK